MAYDKLYLKSSRMRELLAIQTYKLVCANGCNKHSMAAMGAEECSLCSVAHLWLG